MEESRVMAIDYGERKIGIAMTDSLRIISYPYKTIDRKKTPDYVSEIKNIIGEKEIGAIVVGYPITMGGNESKQTKITSKFIEDLRQRINIEVHKCDERLTSKEAQRYLQQQNIKIGHNKEKVDQISASIILDQFLSTIK